ncbi:hypothetical protein [Streptomyces sp. Tu 3180]|uniref:hypothetical protein n=1 Tax=Streptomyces sp. Tu 3180 TaxID=2682611 RepID=UPI001357A922|nr:hypothetical protein [Streptomyces sp. Tu 3180]KAF3466237.1 hypothetical protein GL259_19160 [Streptomyces sp. Tu 3180]
MVNGSAPGPAKGFLRSHAKAVVSALVSGLVACLSSLVTALQGEQSGFDTITDGQWVTAVLAFLVGLGITGPVTSRTPNRPPAGGNP